MKLLYITRWPLGLIATPGTYLTVEAYAENVATRIITHSKINPNDTIVHAPSVHLDLKKYDFLNQDVLKSIQSELSDFGPDIVCIGCFPPMRRKDVWSLGWSDIACRIKAVNPDIKVVLEVKSPLLINRKKLKDLQKRMAVGDGALDAIIAPAQGMVKSWLPSTRTAFLQHRSIIDIKAIERADVDDGCRVCRKIIFSGSIAEKRKIDKLVVFISKLPLSIRDTLIFDFFGDGPAKTHLVQLVKELQLDHIISFKGPLLQKDLFKVYRKYDAGLAWVPSQKYDSAPSLKLSEYCAAGLIPIASNTKGHQLLQNYGLKVVFFNENLKSFTKAMRDVVRNGFLDADLKHNLLQVSDSDYRTVVKQEILPFYKKILDAETPASKQILRQKTKFYDYIKIKLINTLINKDQAKG